MTGEYHNSDVSPLCRCLWEADCFNIGRGHSMTPAELKKLIAARQRGEEAPLLDRLAENARRPFRAPGVPDGVLWYSLIEKPEPG